MSIVFYKRPDYISPPEGPLNKTECERYNEKYKHLSGKTPPELSFDNVIEGRTLPPCTLNDFMDYLVYVERAAENLQFYLWLRDYTARFNALKPEEQALSPEWIWDKETLPLEGTPLRSNRRQSVYEREIDFDSARPGTANKGHGNNGSISDSASSTSKSTQNRVTIKSMDAITEDANNNAGLKWQGFSVQPFRPEVSRAIAHYIAPSSPRELNLSHRDRSAALHALQHTTHPSAFSLILALVEPILRGQAHPNFVRWSVCNGNKAKVLFVRTMSSCFVLLSLLAMTLLVLSRVPRWWRIMPSPLLGFGCTNLVASKKGMCLILTLNHQRDLKPWEIGKEAASTFGLVCKPMVSSPPVEVKIMGAQSEAGSTAELTNRDEKAMDHDRKTKHWTLDSWGSKNEWENEEWVRRYKKRHMLRKAFPGSTWVQAEGIRQLQKKIVRESQVWGLLITVCIVVGFTAIPKGNFY